MALRISLAGQARLVAAFVTGAFALVASASTAMPYSPGIQLTIGAPVTAAPADANVLYDQMGSFNFFGTFVGRHMDPTLHAYDAEGADDFMVIDATGWSVSRVEILGFDSFSGGSWPTNSDVAIYRDDALRPASQPLCQYQNAPTANTPDGSGVSTLAITLAPACVLVPGRYWVAVVPVVVAAGAAYYWGDSDPQRGASGVWRQPGNGFGIGCTNWSPQQTCGLTTADYAFRIGGSVLPPPPPPPPPVPYSYVAVPTLQSWMQVALGLLIGAIGCVSQRRRAHRLGSDRHT